MQINWDNFRTYGHDSRGVRFKFEDLCRQLFANENLSGNKQFRYLHANPNNYGLETEPIYDETNQRWIGFQAKFFDNDIDYSQIKQSAEKIVEYYTGKDGLVDLVYLFCNKPIATTAKGYVDTLDLLKSKNITLQLITDNAILDLVRKKYSYLGLYYFGNHTLQPEWFITHANHMFEELGERFNKEFNIETECMDALSLFVHDQRAADYLNAKKKKLLEDIDKLYWGHAKNNTYLSGLRDAVVGLPDVDIKSLYNALDWKDIIKQQIQSDLDKLTQEVKHLESQQKEAYCSAEKNDENSEERRKVLEKARDIGRHITSLKSNIALPEVITITDREKSLLYGQIMTLSGRAGTGKSQLLAAKTKSLLDEKRAVLLLIAGVYFTDAPILDQITKNLSFDFSWEELIDILETIGEKNNYIVPIFIDAINETWNHRLWKTGLPSIINKLKRAPMVRMVVSYRPEYEQIVLPDSFSNGKENIVRMFHYGFQKNSIEAIRKFLNHYNIPFTPLEYFGYEMSNPLFLTLYCKTYNGEEVSLPVLYERLIEKASANVYAAHEKELSSLGYDAPSNLFRSLIDQIAKYLVTHDERSISKSELMKLDYWRESGLTPAPYIQYLIKENILHDSPFENLHDSPFENLHDSPFENEKKLYFAYDQMNDYYCAKAIIGMYNTKEEARKYLSEKVLGINNNTLEFSWNIDLFVNACVLYAEKYNEECIDIIDVLTKNEDKEKVFSRYVSSFQWRKPENLSGEAFIELLLKYPCRLNDLWSMLIGNSVKIFHPFNADFLHEFLSRYELNRRDYLWTIYINKFTLYESDRVVQLIQMYDKGEKLKITNEKQIQLLLTLFGWILTSSNRKLRDYTSKAMIEILKEHFGLCQTMLDKFKDVNDPYVAQRLYGVVFGACCKRQSGNLQELAEYVYETVFNQEEVYPDILLRDYARLIIEKFLSEAPDYEGIIDHEKIVPPYNSDPIPEIEDQYYENIKYNYNGSISRVLMSMKIEEMRCYGDFGRYVFQSALSHFNVDLKKMFNYAIYHIINDLGLQDDYFEDHDCQIREYDRHLTAKTERIGKKYQWITMHEMLARISDNCKMVDCWRYQENEEVSFKGAWEPYVRDFDPTLNARFMVCTEAPVFEALNEHKTKRIKENKATDISTTELQKNWLEQRGTFLESIKDTLILADNNGQQWICLTKFCDTGRNIMNVEKLYVWSWLYAYFMTQEQAEEFKRCAEKGLPIISNEIASHHETYTIFNREYPWSPSCKDFEEHAWVDAHVKTGEVETITETIQVPYFTDINSLLRKSGIITDASGKIQDDTILPEGNKEQVETIEFDVTTIQYKEETRQREVEKEIGEILHATTNLLWEEKYDATKEEPISRSFPCKKLIEMMELRQLEADGFFFDKDGKLAAFDTNLTQKIDSVVVRKDILDSFISQSGLKLVWLVDAEKEIYAEDYSNVNRSNWEAVFTYEENHITGDINRLPEEIAG